MQELKALPGIVDLNLYFAEYVTDEGLAAIKNWGSVAEFVGSTPGRRFSVGPLRPHECE
jgi:hypothetical protein